jgi:hypothetical protein
MSIYPSYKIGARTSYKTIALQALRSLNFLIVGQYESDRTNATRSAITFNKVSILSGAENFLESQIEKTVTRENSIRVSTCARFLREAEADGGLF